MHVWCVFDSTSGGGESDYCTTEGPSERLGGGAPGLNLSVLLPRHSLVACLVGAVQCCEGALVSLVVWCPLDHCLKSKE